MSDRMRIDNPRNDLPPVTIVCVFNDAAMLEQCLNRSVAAYKHSSAVVEYLPMDNTEGQFRTAGAAFNEAVASASHEIVVFAQQDVYLHSLAAVRESAAAILANPAIAVHGAIGVDSTQRLVGRIRDRVALIGSDDRLTGTVDSVDEVLFMAPRALLEESPLSEDPLLAWHGYAVEYCVRARAAGRSVTAGRIPLTHNTLSINQDGLSESHRRIAELHPGQVPIRTTCGTIAQRTGRDLGRRQLAQLRHRGSGLARSAIDRGIHAVRGPSAVIHRDIRNDVEDVARGLEEPLCSVSVDPRGFFRGDDGAAALLLERRGIPYRISSLRASELPAFVVERRPGQSLLITNLGAEEVRSLRQDTVSDVSARFGFHPHVDHWALVGPVADAPSSHWPATVTGRWR